MGGKTIAALVRCYHISAMILLPTLCEHFYRENDLKHPICSEKVLHGIIKRFEKAGNANPVKGGSRPSLMVAYEVTVDSVSEAKAVTESENDWRTSVRS